MRTYGQAMFGFPQRNDLCGGRVLIIGTNVAGKSSSQASFEFARYKVPGRLLVPGASLVITGNAALGATDTVLVQAIGRNDTNTNIITFGPNSVTFQVRFFPMDWNDASAANLRTVALISTAGAVSFTSATVTLPYLSDDWELSVRNGAGATDVRTLNVFSAELYSVSRYADMAPKMTTV